MYMFFFIARVENSSNLVTQHPSYTLAGFDPTTHMLPTVTTGKVTTLPRRQDSHVDNLYYTYI
jgi:hypothetical protein